MKLIDVIEESHHTAFTMNRIYKVLSQMNKDLSGGNSGMVALAISNFYHNKIKANMRISLIYEDDGHISSVCDLLQSTPKIYAVANKFGSVTYMANYEGSEDGLVRKLSPTKAHLDIISGVDANSDHCVQAVIRKHTNWDTSSYDFYDYLIKRY